MAKEAGFLISLLFKKVRGRGGGHLPVFNIMALGVGAYLGRVVIQGNMVLQINILRITSSSTSESSQKPVLLAVVLYSPAIC